MDSEFFGVVESNLVALGLNVSESIDSIVSDLPARLKWFPYLCVWVVHGILILEVSLFGLQVFLKIPLSCCFIRVSRRSLFWVRSGGNYVI